jgi:hypothetical protein
MASDKLVMDGRKRDKLEQARFLARRNLDAEDGLIAGRPGAVSPPDNRHWRWPAVSAILCSPKGNVSLAEIMKLVLMTSRGIM